MANEAYDRIAEAKANLHRLKTHKTIGLGTKDATFRYGISIPADTPINFSSGYAGSAIHNLSAEYTEGN